MTLEQALLKIIELQQEVMNLKDQLAIKPQPYVTMPLIYTEPDLCNDGNFHNYPTMWHGTNPPTCAKCGKQAGVGITYTTLGTYTTSKVDQ